MSSLATDNVRVLDGEFDIGRLAERPVFYFDLGPVLQHCHALSLRNPDRLRLMCEPAIQKQAPREIVLFRDGGFYLVVQTCTGREAEAIANAVNVALLRLLFGSESLAPGALSVLFRAADAEKIDSAVPQSADTVSGGDDAKSGSNRKTKQTSAEADKAHERIKVELTAVYDLRRKTVSTFFCSPLSVIDGNRVISNRAMQDAEAHDRPWVEAAMLVHTMTLAEHIVKSQTVAAIGTSVSFETLAGSRGRRLYLQTLRDMNLTSHPLVMVKIGDIPVGTPSIRIAEIVATIRPHVRHVLLELPRAQMKFMDSGFLGASGFVASLPANASPAEAASLAKALVGVAIMHRAFSCITDLHDPQLVDIIRDAGVRFASGRAVGAPLPPHFAFQQVDIPLRASGEQV